MGIWLILLRITGTLLLLFGVAGGCLRLFDYPVNLHFWDDVYSAVMPLVQSFALAVLCFGAASLIEYTRGLDRKVTSITNLFNRRKKQEPISLAPDAPAPSNTARYGESRAPLRPGLPVRRIDQEYYTYRTPGTARHRDKK